MIMYRAKFVRGERQFEVEGDKKFVLELIKKYWADVPEGAQEKTPDSGKENKARLSPTSTKVLSVGEFVRQSGFKKHTDFVLAFGYYLEKNIGMKEFAPADINKCYYDAKMESSNTSQMIIQNIRSGRIMQSKSAKRMNAKFYTLTQTGIDYIEKKMAKKLA